MAISHHRLLKVQVLSWIHADVRQIEIRAKKQEEGFVFCCCQALVVLLLGFFQ